MTLITLSNHDYKNYIGNILLKDLLAYYVLHETRIIIYIISFSVCIILNALIAIYSIFIDDYPKIIPS